LHDASKNCCLVRSDYAGHLSYISCMASIPQLMPFPSFIPMSQTPMGSCAIPLILVWDPSIMQNMHVDTWPDMPE